MSNNEKTIKCRVKSDSTFTDLAGYEILVVRDKAFYKIVAVLETNITSQEEFDNLTTKYIGFHIGRKQLEFIDQDNLINESNLMKCKVKPSYYGYDDLEGLELLVTLYDKGADMYSLDYINKNSFKGSENKWEHLIYNYRVGNKEMPLNIAGKFLDFQIEDLNEVKDSKTSTDVLENFTNEYISKSDKTRVYESGAKRDGDINKPYTHNLQGYVRLRFGYLTREGAKKYGDGNFLKGFPDENAIQSLDRHWSQYLNGDRSEDHLSAIIFGCSLLMLNEQKAGIKPDHWFKYEK